MQEYDKSSKWLIQHHGDSILRLAGVDDIETWKPLQAELVQPRRLPDGLIEVRRRGESDLDLYLLEIATYPEARVVEQVVTGTALVFLDRQVVPDVLVLVLSPRGNSPSVGATTMRSRQGWTTWPLSWRTVRLWELPAQTLLAAEGVGLIPWVPLTQFDESPEAIVQECRRRIDRDAPPNEHENLLAVTQFLARLRYNDPRLFNILGGRKAMIEAPGLKEVFAEERQRAQRDAIVAFLTSRFGPEAAAVEAGLTAIEDEDRLKELIKLSATCRNLKSFRKHLS
jgi:hypothetical protein